MGLGETPTGDDSPESGQDNERSPSVLYTELRQQGYGGNSQKALAFKARYRDDPLELQRLRKIDALFQAREDGGAVAGTVAVD